MVGRDQRAERGADGATVALVTILALAVSLLLRPTANLLEPQMAGSAKKLGALPHEIDMTELIQGQLVLCRNEIYVGQIFFSEQPSVSCEWYSCATKD
jgi:hypothetical protein